MTVVFEPWDETRGAEIIAEHSEQEGATLVILHALQEAFGYVPEAAIPMVAQALNLSRAEVHGVFTFYVLARAAGRGRDTAGPDRVRPCDRDRCSLPARRAREQHAASAAARGHRRDPLAQAPDPPDLRALRRDRPALARRLPRPWRLQGPRARALARF